MQKLKMRVAAVSIAVFGLVGGAVAVADAVTSGPTSLGTPGMYAWPASSPHYTQMQFHVTVTKDPGSKANVFWSNQFNTSGNSGYIGYQTVTNRTGGKLVLFSVWGATNCKTGNASYGAHCTSGRETTAFKSARIWYPWKAGVNYRLTVKKAPTMGPGWWTAFFYDPSKNLNVRIGYLAFGGATGGTVSPSVSWVEYFNWNNPKATCGQQLASRAIFGPITGNAGTVPFHATSESSTCKYADHAVVLSGGRAQLTATP